MTSVTSVVPGDNKHAPVSVTAGPAQAATAFADLLDKPAEDKKQAKKTPDHPAYSFAELGMFGLHAVQAVDDSAKAAAPAKATAHAKATAADKEKKNAASTTSKSATPLVYVPFIYGEVTSAAASVDAVQAPSGFASVSAAMPAKTVSASSAKPEASRSAPQQPKAPAQAGKPVPAEQKADDVSVTVSGPEEGLQIALRGPAEPQAEVVKLRRLIEATVAHFEMDMAELHFNGTAIDSAFSLGGANGGGG